MNLKELLEKREDLRLQLMEMLDKAEQEKRYLNDEEIASYEKIEKDLNAVKKNIEIMEKRSIEGKTTDGTGVDTKKKEPDEKELEKREMDLFDSYLRGKVDVESVATREDTAFKKGDNGAVIPSSIANKIIEKVIDMCPIYHDATRYNAKGTLSIPYYDTATQDITMEFADEFTNGTSTAGQFKSISLTGYLARAITDVSKSLANNSQFNIVSFVISHMAKSIAKFIEKTLINGGHNGDVKGLTATTQVVNLASKTAVTVDELIDLQETIPDVYQSGAYWIMNKATRTAIRKLKDNDGQYLLNKDVSARWGYTLLGKDVYTTDSISALGETNKPVIYYGDYTGLAVKVSEDINIEVLRELKAQQHVIEVLGFVEFDSTIENSEKIAVAKTASA